MQLSVTKFGYLHPQFLREHLGNILAFLSGFFLLTGWSNISPFEILLSILGIFTVWHALKFDNLTQLLRRPKYMALVAFALTITVTSYITSETPYFAVFTTLYLIAVYFVFSYWKICDARLLNYLVTGYVTGAVFSSTLGFGAYVARIFTPASTHIPFFWNDSIRMAVFFDDPVVYGAYLIPALLVLLYLFLITQSSKRQLLLFLGMSVTYVNLILSGSRGAWLSAIVTFLMFVWLMPMFQDWKLIRKIFLLGATAVLAASLVIFVIPIDGETYYSRTLANRGSSSDAPRVKNLKETPPMVIERGSIAIMLGSGSGTYAKDSSQNIDPHNLYVKLLYEHGAMGLGLFALFVGLSIRSGLHHLKTFTPSRIIAIIAISVLAGLLIHSFLVDSLHWRHFWILLAFLT